MSAIIQAPYRVLAMLMLVLAGTVFGYVEGCRHTRNADELEASRKETIQEQALVAAHVQARRQEQAWTTTASLMEASGYQALQEKQHEIDSLRAADAAGALRLRVAAHCPAPAAVPNSAAGSSLGDAASPELEAGARPHYFALLAGIDTITQQLTTCQALLKNDRALIPGG